MKLPLAYYGHPILRKKAQPVTLFNKELIDLIENMKETMQAVKGLGLSAPQVGSSYALFITNTLENDNDSFSSSHTNPTVYINPKIEAISEEIWFEEEGCLSIPKVYADVERPVRVTITAQNEQGQWRTESLEKWRAKVIFHENDHLNGVLFIDRLIRRDKKRIDKELESIRRKFEAHNRALIPPL